MPIIRNIIKEQEQKPWRHGVNRFTYIVGACHRTWYDSSSIPLNDREWIDTQDVYAIIVARDEDDAMRQFADGFPDLCRRSMTQWSFHHDAQRVFYCVQFDRYPFNVAGRRGYTLLQPHEIQTVKSAIDDETILARYVR